MSEVPGGGVGTSAYAAEVPRRLKCFTQWVPPEPGTVDPETLFNLGLVDGPIAVVPGVIAVFFYLQYNLTRKRHSEIQEELAQRR